jgi:hypothetical protein
LSNGDTDETQTTHPRQTQRTEQRQGPQQKPDAEEGTTGAQRRPQITAGKLAKEAAKIVAKELGSAASEEAKELGLAATQMAVELGQRRRQRRAEKHNATEAALREAEDAGVGVDEIDGSGVEGRVTVGDVRDAVRER